MAKPPRKKSAPKLILAAVESDSSANLAVDEFDGVWEHENFYFGARVQCWGCGCTDFAGWRNLATGDVRCNDCAIVTRN